MAYGRGIFRLSFLENFLHSGQTLSDVAANGSGAAGVEGSHSKLCSRLAYGLSGHRSDRLAQINQFILAQIKTVAKTADSAMRKTVQGGPDDDFDYSGLLYGKRVSFSEQMSFFEQNRSIRFCRVFAENSSPNRFGYRDVHASNAFVCDNNALLCSTIIVRNDDVLRDVEKSPSQIPGFGGV